MTFAHRFGSYLNSHMHYHVLVTDSVFSPGSDGEAVFHPTLELNSSDIVDVQTKRRSRHTAKVEARGAFVLKIHTVLEESRCLQGSGDPPFL